MSDIFRIFARNFACVATQQQTTMNNENQNIIEKSLYRFTDRFTDR